MTNHTAPAYQSNPFDLIKPSVDGVKVNLKTYLLLILASFAVAGAFVVAFIVALGIGNAAGSFVGGVLTLALVAATLALVVYLSPVPYRLALAMARHKPVGFSEVLSNPYSLGWKVFLTQLLVGLAILGGFLLLIIPGIIFATWFLLAPYVVLEEGLTGVAALKRSKQLVTNRFWDTLSALMLPNVFGILTIIPVLGSLAYIVLAFLLAPVSALRYLQLKALKEHSDGKDVETNKWAYAVVVLAFIGSSVQGSVNQYKAPVPTNLETENPYYLESN